MYVEVVQIPTALGPYQGFEFMSGFWGTAASRCNMARAKSGAIDPTLGATALT
jgi:hypothetical protein